MATICQYIRSHKSTFSEASLGCVAVVIFALSLSNSRHARQHVEHDGEVELLPPHGARGSEELVADGSGGDGNIKLTAQLHREQHVLLHHVHVEPCLFRLLQHERTTV